MMRVSALSVTPIFPGRALPHQGVFIKERLRAVPDSIAVEVVRMRPYFPLIGLFKPHLAVAVPPQEQVDGITVRDLRYPYVPRYTKARDGIRAGRALGAFVDRLPAAPDVLDAHFAFPTGDAAVIAGRERAIPVVVTLRGTIGSYTDEGRRLRITDTLKGATRIIAVSSSLARLAREIAGEDLDVTVIPNGVDTDRFFPAEPDRRILGLSEQGPILLTVGGLVRRKGAARVIAILPRLLARHPDLLYVVVGGGGVEGNDGAMVRRLVKRLGVQRHVRFVGAVPHDRLAAWYRAADLFCLATSNEGWANVLQESLACGTPVVATDVGGNSEVVGGEANGIIVPFGDEDALASAIDEGLSRSWDRAAIARFGGRRTWTHVGKEVAAVLRDACRNG